MTASTRGHWIRSPVVCDEFVYKQPGRGSFQSRSAPLRLGVCLSCLLSPICRELLSASSGCETGAGQLGGLGSCRDWYFSSLHSIGSGIWGCADVGPFRAVTGHTARWPQWDSHQAASLQLSWVGPVLSSVMLRLKAELKELKEPGFPKPSGMWRA